jgi:hypothetical protein
MTAAKREASFIIIWWLFAALWRLLQTEEFELCFLLFPIDRRHSHHSILRMVAAVHLIPSDDCWGESSDDWESIASEDVYCRDETQQEDSLSVVSVFSYEDAEENNDYEDAVAEDEDTSSFFTTQRYPDGESESIVTSPDTIPSSAPASGRGHTKSSSPVPSCVISSSPQEPALPRPVSPSPSPPRHRAAEAQTGDAVKIKGGKHKGKTGIFEKETKERFGIRLHENPAKVLYLAKTNVEFQEDQQLARNNQSDITAAATRSHEILDETKPSSSVSSRTSPQSRTATPAKNKGISSQQKFTKSTTTLATSRPKHQRYSLRKPRDDGGSQNPVAMTDPCLLHSFLGFNIDYIQLLPPTASSQLERTFASKLFRHRLVMVKINATKDLKQLPIQYKTEHGRIYELLCTKLHRVPAMFGGLPRMSITATYVLIQDPLSSQLPPIDLQQKLSSLASFGSLCLTKSVARLELLLSTAATSNLKQREHLIFSSDNEDDAKCLAVEMIPEVSHLGCGFILRSYIYKYLGHHAIGQRTFALRVRYFDSRYGIFKGMLMVKNGIDKIQLPLSTFKVPPPAHQQSSIPQSCLLVGARFPSQTNVYMAKILNGDKPPTSFRAPKLSSMMLAHWSAHGVPNKILKEYASATHGQNFPPECLRHASLVGLTDPTTNASIPSDSVFITGIVDPSGQGGCRIHFPDVIYATRFPCTKASDGRLVRVIQTKPPRMCDSDWIFLSQLAFGGIIFGNPSHPGQTPLPEQIANGDLDGDLFFVCWEQTILSYLSSYGENGGDSTTTADNDNSNLCRLQNEASAAGRRLEEGIACYNSNWFREAQEYMADIQQLKNQRELISKLHKAWHDTIEKEGYHHPDTEQLGEAYKEALDVVKHGGLVTLSEHLWCHIPERLHNSLCDL